MKRQGIVFQSLVHKIKQSFFVLLLMNFMIGLSFLVISPSYAEEKRISDEDRKELLEDIDSAMAEYRKETKDNIKLKEIKPEIETRLQTLWRDHSVSLEEIEEAKKRTTEMGSKDDNKPPLSAQEKVDLVKKTVEGYLDYLNSRKLVKAKEGELCNNLKCVEGTTCSPAPNQFLKTKFKSCMVPNQECQRDDQCCSKFCVLNKKKKRKYCSTANVCFRPQRVGESCDINPLCKDSRCQVTNLNTNQIGECALVSKTCFNDIDCCSNKCQRGTCVANLKCTDCVQNGGKPKGKEECCEGLLENKKGRCVPDLPPFEIPLSFFKSLSFSFFPKAYAETMDHSFNASLGRRAELRDQVENEETENLGSYAGATYDFNSEISSEVRNKIDKYNQEKILKTALTKASLTSLFSEKGLLGSNVNYCYFDLWSDYLKSSSSGGSLKHLMFLFGFETVAMGNNPEDYWAKIFYDGRMRNFKSFSYTIAEKLRKLRGKFKARASEKEKELTCRCMDFKNYFKLSEIDKSYFRDKCPLRYAEKYKDLENAPDIEKFQFDDASGIKGEQMLIEWLEALREVYSEGMGGTIEDLKLMETDDNAFESIDFASIDWQDSVVRNKELFNYQVVQPETSYFSSTPVQAAILVLGVVAVILGGLGHNLGGISLAFVGVTLSTAYIVGTLRGVWYNKGPEIKDEIVSGRNWYKCLSKRHHCAEVKRSIYYPHSRLCDIPAHSNACIKRLYFYNEASINSELEDFELKIGGLPVERDQDIFLVDPWFPDSSNITANSGSESYTKAVKEGFDRGVRHLKNRPPKSLWTTSIFGMNQDMFRWMTGQNDPNDRGYRAYDGYVYNAYLREPFIDGDSVTTFTPVPRYDAKVTNWIGSVRTNIFETMTQQQFLMNKNLISFYERENINYEQQGSENGEKTTSAMCDGKLTNFLNELKKVEHSGNPIDLGSGDLDFLLQIGRESYVDANGNKIKMDSGTYACVLLAFGTFPRSAMMEYSNYILNWHVLYPHTNLDAAAYPIPALMTYMEVLRTSINSVVVGMDVDIDQIEEQLEERIKIQTKRLSVLMNNGGSAMSNGIKRDYSNIADRISALAESLDMKITPIGGRGYSQAGGNRSATASGNSKSLANSKSASGGSASALGIDFDKNDRAAAKFKDNLKKIQLGKISDYRNAMKGKEARVNKLKAAQSDFLNKITDPFAFSKGGSLGSGKGFESFNIGNLPAANNSGSKSNYQGRQVGKDRAVYGTSSSSYRDSSGRGSSSSRRDRRREKVRRRSHGDGEEIHHHEHKRTIFDYISERYNKALEYLGL